MTDSSFQTNDGQRTYGRAGSSIEPEVMGQAGDDDCNYGGVLPAYWCCFSPLLLGSDWSGYRVTDCVGRVYEMEWVGRDGLTEP